MTDHSEIKAVVPGTCAETKLAAASSPHYLAVTHEVLNQPTELANYNLYASDTALREAVDREGGGWADAALHSFGARLGTPEYLELGQLANKFQPELDTHDRFGHRVDLVRFHPAYHTLMKTAIEEGLHASPWTDPGPGAHVARAARFYMQSQVEAGHGQAAHDTAPHIDHRDKPKTHLR